MQQDPDGLRYARWQRPVRVVCVVWLLVSLTGVAVAQSPSAAAAVADSAAAPRPSSPPGPDPLLVRQIATHRQGQATKHLTRGKRLFDKHQYAQAAREYAVAYMFDPQSEVLIEVARACRKAELDDVAQAVYFRLHEELPQSRYQSEIAEELKSLNYALEDIELNLTQSLQYRMAAAKQEFQAGHFSSAVLEYALAYAVKRLPRLVFNTAQAFRRDGHGQEAYVLYVGFLAEDPESPVKKETLGYLKELRGAAFPPPLYRRAVFWIPLVSSVVAVAAVGLGLSYGLSRPAADTRPVLLFNFP